MAKKKGIYTLDRVLAKCYSAGTQTEIVEPNGARWWAQAIPMVLWEASGRFHAAWAVLRGNAIAMHYPQPGQLERGLAAGQLRVTDARRSDV